MTTPRWMLLPSTMLAAACLAAPDRPFESEIARLAGRAAVQCGIFKLQNDARTAAGWQCAQDAERAGRPYWIALMGHGDDSAVGHAAIRTPAGEHLLLDYGGNRLGAEGRSPEYSLRATPCPAAFAWRPDGWPRPDCAAP